MTSTGQRHIVLVLTFLMLSWLLGFSSTGSADFDIRTKNTVSNAPAENVLLKIPFAGEAELHRLLKSELVVRYQDRDFVIAQANSQRLYEIRLPSYTIIDKIQPGAQYYFVRAETSQILTALEDAGDVLLTFDRTALLRGDVHTAEALWERRLPFRLLLDMVVTLPARILFPMRSIKSFEEVVADTASIQRLIDSVDPEKIKATIYGLQENVELDPPHTPYRSRFTLRVKNTDNPSDEALDNAAEYIFREFLSYGLEVEYEPFTISTAFDPYGAVSQHGGGTYEPKNVVATLPGTGPNKDFVYIICGHYDSIALDSTGWLNNWKTMEAPGADDNASGTAGVLEAARVLSKEKFDMTIKFIAFAGEELVVLGSTHYANAAKGKEEIIGVLNMDMIGYEPDVMDIPITGNDRSEWLLNAMSTANSVYKLELIVDRDVDPSMIYGDHAPFWNAGFSAVSINEAKISSPELSPYWHTTEDTVDKLNIEFASRITQLTMSTVAELANPANVDLAVYPDEVRFSTDMPRRGEKVTLTANVHNTGAVDAENVIVEVRLRELPGWFKLDKIKEERISVKAGEVKNISASFSLTELGEYEVSVRLNPDSTIKEKDFRNNVASKEITLFYTDLSVKAEDIRFSNVHPAYWQDVTMTALIRNVGHDDAVGTSVEVRLLSPSEKEITSKTLIISEENIDINAGDAKEISAKFSLRKWGVYKVYIAVNLEYQDEEINQDNNEALKSITLSPPDLIVEAGDIRFSNPTPKKGEQVSVIAQIGNLGEGDSPLTRVQILLTNPGANKQQMINEQRVEVEAKGKKEISAFLFLPIWGKYEVTVKVNPNNDVFETDFGNNEAKGTLVVSSALAMEKMTVYPNPVRLRKDGQVRLYYELSKDASVVFEVYTVLGELVFRSEFSGEGEGGSVGPNRIAWQGVNSNGERVASGVYICRLIVTGGQTTLTKLKKMALFR